MKMMARHILNPDVHTVSPTMPLPELEREFMRCQVSGFPVVENGWLVGIISQADIVRQLCVEQSIAEVVSDYYRLDPGLLHGPGEPLSEIGGQVGERMERLTVGDVMIRQLISVSPSDRLSHVAQTLVDHHIHRVTVTEEGRLVGIISTIDFVRLFANHQVDAHVDVA